jgi:hypothetical protein
MRPDGNTREVQLPREIYKDADASCLSTYFQEWRLDLFFFFRPKQLLTWIPKTRSKLQQAVTL